MTIRPDLENVPPFYRRYVDHVKDQDMLEALQQSGEVMQLLLKTIPEAQGEYRYAAGKWSIKELLCHLMDAERIFCYRALRFGRNDTTPLPGFEENDYAPQANAHSRSVSDLAAEMQRLRLTTIDLFKSFTGEMLKRSGSANGTPMSVLTLGYVIAGHEHHHRNVLKERYLSGSQA
jgi:uncharacterized damage-inducible protein DinB